MNEIHEAAKFMVERNYVNYIFIKSITSNVTIWFNYTTLVLLKVVSKNDGTFEAIELPSEYRTQYLTQNP
ncbi:MAG TPA: hypothetical protein PLI68_08210 [Bacteroidia bacterium]|nr:hypothetical protein [Bacteroidia bacterium]